MFEEVTCVTVTCAFPSFANVHDRMLNLFDCEQDELQKEYAEQHELQPLYEQRNHSSFG